MNGIVSTKELDKLIKECKTPQELDRLQSLFANEIIGRITDKQALKILEAKNKLINGGK